MRVGVLTGGGDCPGLNAVIRAVVRKGVQEYGLEFVGFRDGWRGPLEGDTVPLDVQAVRGILPRGGTILGSSRTNPLKNSGGGLSPASAPPSPEPSSSRPERVGSDDGGPPLPAAAAARPASRPRSDSSARCGTTRKSLRTS